MRRMKILITGSNGFIARNIIAYGCSELDVYGIGRSPKAVRKDITYIQVDISNRRELFEQIMARMSTVDIIVHAAAEISDDVEKLYSTNCYGTQNMVDLAKILKCKKFIYISSIPVIGRPIEIPITERHVVSPKTVYHYTKYFGEQIVAQLSVENIMACTLRIASPVGAGMPCNKIFSVFVEKSRANKNIEIYGDGKRIQNYIDVRDLAEAVKKVIDSHVQGIYNIPGESISDIELAKCCKDFYHSNSKIQIREIVSEIESEKWIISGEAAKREFGYVPQKTIKDSISYVVKGKIK